MNDPTEARPVDLAPLGERLSSLRLCEAPALEAMRRSLAEHGQLSALTLFSEKGHLEIVDGFKRVRAARALGWPKLVARVDELGSVGAKLRLRELHVGCRLTEIEEGWLVRSLYREDGLNQPEIARRLNRDKSWVWRRLMLVESLAGEVQAEVRLGLLAPRAAVAVSRLPRGNQQAASKVVIQRGLTVRQTDLLVDEVLCEMDAAARAKLLEQRLAGSAPERPSPRRRASRLVRSEADWMSADILRVRETAARLEARLLATPLSTFEPAAAELVHSALVRLSPALRTLDQVIGTVTSRTEVA